MPKESSTYIHTNILLHLNCYTKHPNYTEMKINNEFQKGFQVTRMTFISEWCMQNLLICTGTVSRVPLINKKKNKFKTTDLLESIYPIQNNTFVFAFFLHVLFERDHCKRHILKLKMAHCILMLHKQRLFPKSSTTGHRRWTLRDKHV